MAYNFDTVFNTLKSGITTLAETDLKNYVSSAEQDGQAILDQLKTDLETWAEQAAGGTLSGADFQDLLLGQKDELEMVALKDAGLADIAVDQFKADVLNIILTTINALIP
jgi:hypothetical protein